MAIRDINEGQDFNVGTSPLIKLQSKEHEDLLNVIDQLRSEGISQYVDLPQLIVCGDQSSGKSSVLEAISGLDFPRKDSLCTRFATELILRHSDVSGVKASIYPDENRPSREQDRLRSFNPPTLDLGAFAKIVKSAEEFIGLGEHGSEFSKDILRVEVSGPSQPHLTLVDLPGLYHGESESQSQGGAVFVEELVLSHMQKSRSVILAVMSAQSEIPLQKVTSFTRKVDPNGERTMGIITKPDTLSKGSPMEQSFHRLAQNKNKSLQLRLGWHVLRNRKYEELRSTLQERHNTEADFLAKGIWGSLPRSQVGVESLRPRLSTVLKDHILTQMPSFVAETQSTLKDTEHSLGKLGQARETRAEQRKFLLQSSERFTNLMSNAVNGIYFDYFFGDPLEDEGYEKRLRAVVQNRLLDFAEEILEHGEDRRIVDDDDDDYASDDETMISRSAYVKEVKQRIRRSRGRELPGTFNPLIVGDLFYLQSRPWKGIVDECIDTLIEDIRKATIPILEEVLDERSLEGVLKHVINPYITQIEDGIRKKSTELLRPQQMGHPITYNQSFVKTVQEARNKHLRSFITERLKTFFAHNYPNHPSVPNNYGPFAMSQLIDSLSEQDEEDMEQFGCSEATDCMLAFYRVARKHLVDDFGNLAVEECLMKPLSTMYCSATVYRLSNEVVEDIASEEEETQLERGRLNEKLKRLRWALTRLQRLDRRNLRARRQDDSLNERQHGVDDEVVSVIGENENSQPERVDVEDQKALAEIFKFKKGKEVPAIQEQDALKGLIETLTQDADGLSKLKMKKKKHPTASLYE